MWLVLLHKYIPIHGPVNVTFLHKPLYSKTNQMHQRVKYFILFWFWISISFFFIFFLVLFFFYFETLVHLVGFTIEIYSDTRPCELQISPKALYNKTNQMQQCIKHFILILSLDFVFDSDLFWLCLFILRHWCIWLVLL